jgi:hypothetical protein
MWITLIAIGMASVGLRAAGITGALGHASPAARYIPALFGVCGSCAILGFAVLMVIPG